MRITEPNPAGPEPGPARTGPAPRGPARGLRRTCLALTLTATLVAACGAPGDQEFRKTRDSNYGQIGDVVLLHVHLATPPERDWQPGATVPLHLTLTNGGHRPATLTAVDSPAATGGVVYPAADGTPGPVRIPLAPGATSRCRRPIRPIPPWSGWRRCCAAAWPCRSPSPWTPGSR